MADALFFFLAIASFSGSLALLEVLRCRFTAVAEFFDWFGFVLGFSEE